MLATIADVMARELDWSEDDKREQISRVKQFFAPFSECKVGWEDVFRNSRY